MRQVVTIVNRKYYRPFDGSDNPCCWQVGEVGRDIESLLLEFGIDAAGMYEDWGAAWSWYTGGVEHSMQLTCTDVDRPAFQIEYFALRTKWYVFRSDVPDDQSDFRMILPRLRQFGDEAA
jgi:hypothetical protein